ncbi:MAG: aminotransferase class III-fold pyridoxal phosphate-dependent enzyme, partial [Phycisphaerae bacterium]
SPGRINSTWGGNFTDMVRSTHYLKIIEREQLVNNAAAVGEMFQEKLNGLAAGSGGLISAVRGRGLLLAFSFSNGDLRNTFWKECYEAGLFILRCGDCSIRLRPVLDIQPGVVDEAIGVMKDVVGRMANRE